MQAVRWTRFASLALAAVALALAAAHLAGTDYPLGHDGDLHIQNAAALHETLRNAPGDAVLFLRSGLFHYPPLGAMTTALLLFVAGSPWAYHLTQLLFAAVFLSFLLLLISRITQATTLRLAALAAVLASPEWMRLAASYNLEMCLAASLAFATWIMLSRRPEGGWAAALGWGAAVGMALLSKPVVALYLAPIAAWSAREAWRNGRARPWLCFAAAALAVAGPFYAPALAKGYDEFLDDFLDRGAAAAQPASYYVTGLFTAFAIAPLLVGLAWLARRVRWREIPGAAWACLAAAAFAVLLLSFFHTKRIWYVDGAHVLVVLFAVAALSTVEPARLRRVGPLLGATYAALAVLGWFSWANPATRLLSLGSGDYAAPFFAPPSAAERRLAQNLRALLDPWELCPTVYVDLRGAGRPTVVAAQLAADDHAFAFRRGWIVPNEYWPGLRMGQRLQRACRIAVVMEAAAGELTAEALGLRPADAAGQAVFGDVERVLATERNQWRCTARAPIDVGRELALLEHGGRAAAAERATAWADLLDFYLADGAEAADADVLAHFAAAARRDEGRRALRGLRLFLAAHPGHPAATLAWIASLSAALSPAEEADALTRFLTRQPTPPGASQAALARLADLERSGLATAALAQLTAAWLAQRPPNDEARTLALFQAMAVFAGRGATERMASFLRGPGVVDADRETVGDVAEQAQQTGRLDEAAFIYEAMVARWPDDAASWFALADCRRLQGRSELEANVILRLLPRFPIASPPFRERFARLAELAAAGVAQEEFAAWAERVLSLVPAGDAWRSTVATMLVRALFGARKSAEAAAVVQRETAELSDKEATFALWDYAQAAYAAGDGVGLALLADRLAADPNLDGACKDVLREERAGVAAAQRPAPSSSRARRCDDFVAIGNAANLLANEDYAGAAARLRLVRWDPELRRQAAEMLRKLPPAVRPAGPG